MKFYFREKYQVYAYIAAYENAIYLNEFKQNYQHFQDRNELENAVTVYINSKEGTNFYANSIRKLPKR